MKKNILLLLISAVLANYAHAQCDKEISTNPFNPFNDEFLPLMNDWFESDDPSTPIYTVNSFLNSAINWYPGNGIQLDLNENWVHDFGNSNSLSMTNPFANNHNQTHLWLPSLNENERDFRWEDGWELLWMNIGKSPNGDPYSAPSQGTYFAHGNQNASGSNYAVSPDAIDPSNIPYFVLYNRYRGMIRLFANVWQGGSTGTQGQEWAVTMGYTTDDFLDQNISGLFRYASSIDRPLDQPTEHTQIIGPRTQSINESNWAVAEFPMAFDPCICMKEKDPSSSKNPGRIEFLFEIIETSEIDLYSRSIEIEQEITAATLNEDFLNLSETNENDFKPGTAMYRQMGDMFTQYQAELDKYNDDLNDYNNAWNSTKYQLLNIAKNFVTSGISLVIPAGEIFKEVLKKDAFEGTDDANKITNNAIKGLVGSGVDYASMEIFGKKADKPVKPTAPTASFRETTYKGKLTRTFYEHSPPLLIPGGINADFVPSSIDPALSTLPTQIGYGHAQLYTRIFPAYNKLLGTSALLKTPESKIYYDFYRYSDILSYYDQVIPGNDPLLDPTVTICEIEKEIVGNTDFKFKLDEIQMALNRNLDFDFEKTKTYVRIEVQISNEVPELSQWNLEYYGANYINFTIGSNPEFDFTSELSADNMHLSHEFPIADGGTRRIYSSKWILLEELNQYIFSLNIVDKAFYAYTSTTFEPDEGCPPVWPFYPPLIEQKLESVKLKVLQDNYFQQIGHLEEQVNTSQVTSYYLFNAEENINYLGDQSNWNEPQTGVFDQYTPGIISIGSKKITPTHPSVHEVIGSDIFVNGQEILIKGDFPILVPGFYFHHLNIQALEQIHIVPGTLSNPTHLRPEGVGASGPKTHLRIKKDFYDTPVFEYAENAAVYNFCNNSSQYQANTASRPLMERILKEQAELAALEKSKPAEISTIKLYPNPTSGLLQITSSRAPISQIEVYDLSGRRLYHRIFGTSPGRQVQVDLSALSNGVYVVKTTSGGVVSTEKLVVGR